MRLLINGGQPIPPWEIAHAVGLDAHRDVADRPVWVWLRLAQAPNHVYRGRFRWLRPERGTLCWRIGTELAFHADSVRVSYLGRDVPAADKCLAVAVIETGEAEPEPVSVGYEDLLTALARGQWAGRAMGRAWAFQVAARLLEGKE